MLTFQCRCNRVFSFESVPTVLRCSCGLQHNATADNVQTQPSREGSWIPESPCAKRGDVQRKMEGRCCGGRQVVDVFACTVHGDCTYRNTRAGKDKPHPCLGCEDWVA
jgi:hypothetical protein